MWLLNISKKNYAHCTISWAKRLVESKTTSTSQPDEIQSQTKIKLRFQYIYSWTKANKICIYMNWILWWTARVSINDEE